MTTALVLFLSSMLPLPVEQWDETTKLTLARALVAEADWHERDHEAIAWVLVKRWRMASRNLLPGVSFRKFVTLYSKPLSAKSPRVRAIQRLAWSEPPKGLLRRFADRWEKVREWVDRFGQGYVADPCPRAMHWGGIIDRPRPGWEIVNCGRTFNIFYRPSRYR